MRHICAVRCSVSLWLCAAHSESSLERYVHSSDCQCHSAVSLGQGLTPTVQVRIPFPVPIELICLVTVTWHRTKVPSGLCQCQCYATTGLPTFRRRNWMVINTWKCVDWRSTRNFEYSTPICAFKIEPFNAQLLRYVPAGLRACLVSQPGVVDSTGNVPFIMSPSMTDLSPASAVAFC